MNFIQLDDLTPQWGQRRGGVITPSMGAWLHLPSPIKTPEAPREENPLWESAGGDRSDNGPWKARSSETNKTKPALARQVGRGSPHQEHPVPVGCAHPPSGSSAPSRRGQASGEARGDGQATITGFFFQMKPNPRAPFCHPASHRSATVRNA